jgi:predicted DNA-binding protein (MmcQ/YjbR family)
MFRTYPALILEMRASPDRHEIVCGADSSRCKPMRPAELRDHCLAFPGSAETFPFGPETSVFKVSGKVFALSQLNESPLRVSLKCEPVLAEQLREAHPAVLPGYHLNKRHWNTVIIDGSLPKRMIKEMIEDSYDLIVSKLPRSRRQALGWVANE